MSKIAMSCNDCIHSSVCKYKKDYQAAVARAQEAQNYAGPMFDLTLHCTEYHYKPETGLRGDC